MLDLNSLRNAAAKPSGRRVHHRRKFDSSNITVDLGFARATLNDLSESGMAVRASGPLRIAPGAQLQVSLPDIRRPIEATCQLAWTAESGMAGMRFLVLAQGSQRAIREWLTCEEPCTQTWKLGPSAAMVEVAAAPELKSEVKPAPIVTPAAAVTAAIAPPPAIAPAPVVTSVVAPAADLSYGLRLMVELVKILTRADGVALALRDAEQMICRASIGTAPDLGVQLRADSGLSGECLRSGLTVRSDDTSCDPRVDAEACRILGVGSIAVTPVFRDGATDGVLEILSRRPHGFSHSDIALLPQMADLVARMITRAKEISGGPSSDSGNGIGKPMLRKPPSVGELMDTAAQASKTDLPPVPHKGRRYVPAENEPGQGTIRISPDSIGNA
jgi:putative methionine-R-sulfoxide reductase with GAF domain